MNKRLAVCGSVIILGIVGALAGWVLTHLGQLTLLQARGPIALQERNLMGVALGLMLLVIVPVYVLIFTIALRYRAGNTRARGRYRPNWDSDRRLEALWWGVPLTVITILATVTWVSTHQLDPVRPIVSSHEPLTVQVVALRYKWLFIYPDYNLAALNWLEIPAGRPISLQITADAPMNSFWLPQLGGQIYAMPGMSTQLNLQADHAGDYRGVSANLSGAGFADMHFTARAVSDAEFTNWIGQVRAAGGGLDSAAYTALASHAASAKTQTYAVAAGGLYHDIVAQYRQPTVNY